MYFSRPKPDIDEQAWNQAGEVERWRDGLMEGSASGAWTDFQGERWESAKKISQEERVLVQAPGERDWQLFVERGAVYGVRTDSGLVIFR